MKTSTFIIALSAAALSVSTARAQNETSTTTTTTTTYIPTTTIVGSRVTGSEGAEIGQISNVVLDKQTGCMAYVVLSTGESGGTARTVAVPWSVFSPGSDEHTYTVTVDRQKIESAPVWESSRIDEYSRPEWVGSVYSYYGVQPGAQTNVRANINVGRDQQRASERTNVQSVAPAEKAQSLNPDTLTHNGRNGVHPPGASASVQETPPAATLGDRSHQAESATQPDRAGEAQDRAGAREARREARREKRANASGTSNAAGSQEGAPHERAADAAAADSSPGQSKSSELSENGGQSRRVARQQRAKQTQPAATQAAPSPTP